ncbi:MAG: signal recognition particle protein Srp54 [Candidatus Methanofastidiosia archaeon]
MALEALSKKLNDALRKLTKRVPDEKLIKEIVKDIQRALLTSDVNVQLVFELSRNIERRALEEKLPPGISRREHIVKVVFDEIVKVLGEEKHKISLQKRPTKILMVGIQGSGKTTTCGKLARFYQKRGFKVGIVCADTFRFGALEQLREYSSVEVYGSSKEKNSIKLAKNGIKHFKGRDLIIIDTAGRHKEEKGLLEEMRELVKAVKPQEVILVIDGTLGQQAKPQAEAFAKATEIGSVIVTKLDGSGRGGGALSAVAATRAPLKFIGDGEKIDRLEEFDPKKFVARILGLGDLESLLHKVREAAEVQEFDEKAARKFIRGKFNLKDMYSQLEMISQMGPLQQIMQMIPGVGVQLPEEMIDTSEEKLKKFRVIMDSMTEKELSNPKIIHFSQIKRIARGSGCTQKEVKELLTQYNMMRKLFKQIGKRGKGKLPQNLLKSFGMR